MAVLCTGAGATVTAQMDADLFAGIVGNEKIVLAVGRQMEAAIVDNNTVRIYDGSIVCQGRNVYIEPNTSDDFYIDTGEQGVTRYDIIGYRLYREGGKELCEQFVQKNVGESEDIEEDVFRNGAEEVYLSMYKVRLDGLTIAEITPMYSSVLTAVGDINKSVKKTMEDVLNNQIINIDNAFTLGSTYVEIKSQMVRYNKLTGAVHGDLSFHVIKDMSDGTTYNLGAINTKYAPIPKVAATFSVSLNDCYVSGRIQERSHETAPGRLVGRPHMNVGANNEIFVSFDYYIEPGLVD